MHIYTIEGKYEYDDGNTLQIATESISKALDEFALLVNGHKGNEYAIVLTDWQDGSEMFEYNYSCEDNVVWNEKRAGLMDMAIVEEFMRMKEVMTKEAELRDAKEEVSLRERQLIQAKRKLDELSK